MLRPHPLIIMGFIVVVASRSVVADEVVLFEDNFDKGLSPKWSVAGLKKQDYRIKDGGLEMRVRPRTQNKETPMLKVVLPFNTFETVNASVEMTPLDPFTVRGETAGLYLLDEDLPEFHAEKTNANGYFVFSPPELLFIGKAGTEEENNRRDYAVKFWPANPDFGALRIITRGHQGTFQVGPTKEGKYLTLFERALNRDSNRRGFALSTYGGPIDKEHWVRFDNFRVVRIK
ncbi:MAG: hypothetical protein JWM11_7453 [Planctomycetaceae bacterium]|nr:hypothetical protein [Planctomycetaceae bacterium]